MNIASVLALGPSLPETDPLTGRDKKRTLPMRDLMKRVSFIFVFFCSLVFLLPTACRRPHVRSQLESGIWASEKDLWDEAIFRWKKFLAAHPESVAAHNNLAVAYEKKGVWDDARQEYEAALKIDPLNPSVKYNYDQFQANVDLQKKPGSPSGSEHTETGNDAKK